MTLTWPQFLAALLGLYFCVNVVFALLYISMPHAIANARPYSVVDAFFFSLETLATVGYGEMYPATLYGHLVAGTEIVCGLAFTAILTGLTFVRFSRPRAKFVFADNPVICLHNGKPTLMLRIGNGRADILSDTTARLNALISERSTEGTVFRRAAELKLQRGHIPIFPLAWTIMHVLDEQSPLAGLDAAGATREELRLFVTLEARDPTLATTVHDLRDYSAEDIRFGWRYVDAIENDPDGRPMVDLRRISDIEPDRGADAALREGWPEQESATLERD